MIHEIFAVLVYVFVKLIVLEWVVGRKPSWGGVGARTVSGKTLVIY